jgi:hypothetical protein
MYHAHEDLLFCQPLEGRTTGEDIFAKLNEFFTSNEVSQNNCVGVCMGDAAEMTDRKHTLLGQTKNLNNATASFIRKQWMLQKLSLNLMKTYKKELLY